MPPKSRPIDAQLDAWILSLFPVEKLPTASGDAEQYIDQIDGEIIDKYAPTVSGWQYIAKRLCTLVYDYAKSKEEMENLTKRLEDALKENRENNKILQDTVEALTQEVNETISQPSDDAPTKDWERHIDGLIAMAKDDYKAVIRRGCQENKEKSTQIRVLTKLIDKMRQETDLEDIARRLGNFSNTKKTEPLQSPPKLTPENDARRQRRRTSSVPETKTEQNQRNNAPDEGDPENQGDKPDTKSPFDLLVADKVKRLQKCDIDYFYGTRDKAPYREDFSIFHGLFERFAEGVPETIKLDELIKRLRSQAFTHMTNINNPALTYEGLVRSLKAVFFRMETSHEKRSKYENLKQGDEEHLEIFQIKFENSFKEYYTLISGSNSAIHTDEVFRCNEFVTKIRPILKQQIMRRRKILFEEKDSLKWDSLMEELRLIEKEYPAKKGDQRSIDQKSRSQPLSFNKIDKSKNTQNQTRVNRGSFTKIQSYPSFRGGYSNQPRGGGNQFNRNTTVPPYQGPNQSKQLKCFNCNQDGHRARDCKMQPRNDPFQPKGNSIKLENANRGNNRGRGNMNRGNSRGNFRGNNKQPQMKVAFDTNQDYGSEPMSSLSYAEQLANANMASQFDPETEPIIHTISSRLMKCVNPENQVENEVPTFSLAAARYRPAENPSWISTSAREDTLDRVTNRKKFLKLIAENQQKRKRTAAEKALLNSVQTNKWTCVDEVRLVCPLIIEGVCIEDVLPDTGSQFNAMSLKALWALIGRFPSWEKAFETATSWCFDEKVIQAAGGQEIPILGVIRLHVQVAGKKAMPIHWAIYEDIEPIIVLGTKGMKALDIELKSQNLGNINILVPKDEVVATSNKVYNAAFHTPIIRKTPKTPEDAIMQSDESMNSPMDIQLLDEQEAAKRFLQLNDLPKTSILYDSDMARLGLTSKSDCQNNKNSIIFDKTLGQKNTHKSEEDIPTTSYRMNETDQVFRQTWDQWRSQAYDE